MRGEYIKKTILQSMESSIIEKESEEEDGTWYAISAEESEEDEPEYPVESCADLKDAWGLVGRGDYTVSEEELRDRLKQRAEELGCDDPSDDE